ncbi:alcohol dehydrogenase catalytic domain-containing protein [Labedella phragmitis]|nr:alcohol dehydrogenase catalytic domain-containing protein [Labedella phragmitis]
MRATRRPAAPVMPPDDAGPKRRDVIVRPVPLAMVWQGPGSPHAAIAVPGVSLGSGDVLVAVEFATVCPVDAATVRGDGTANVPLVLGHEQVGRVAAIGDGAETADGARLIVGMRVVWSRRIGCGECDACRAGSPSGCATAREYGSDRLRRGWELSGGFATHVLVRAGTAIITVPEIVPAAVLAPVPCATALAAAALEIVAEATEVDGESVVVVGAGLVGLTIAAMLADEGARVVMVEADAVRRSRAVKFGAVSAVCDLTAAAADGRVIAAVVDTDGGQEAARPHAAVRSHDAVVISTGAATGGAITIVDRPDPRHLAAAVGFISNAWYRFPFERLVAERYPLERLDVALRAASDTPAVRVGIETASR